MPRCTLANSPRSSSSRPSECVLSSFPSPPPSHPAPQILGPVRAPLPSELPPSPPASREPSPTLKRRQPPESTSEPLLKRPRVDSQSSVRPHHLPPRPVPVASPTKLEPQEDGELKEEPTASSSSVPVPVPALAPTPAPPSFPVRRPRRAVPSSAEWTGMANQSFRHARILKYSGYARIASEHPPTSKDYKPLSHPPPAGSPYALHSLRIARLEIVESFVQAVYAIWCMDQIPESSRNEKSCNRNSWRTTEEAVRAIESKLQAEAGDEREKAFVGLIQMIHGFILSRKVYYAVKGTDAMNDRKLGVIREKKKALELARNAQQTNMLPSPASSSTTSSSHSTPLGGHNAAPHRPPPPPPPPHPTAENSDIRVDVTEMFLLQNRSLSGSVRMVGGRFADAEDTLSLSTLCRHFPRTFARVVHSNLSAQDEYQPDFQDQECELHWPVQSLTGGGLGWACHMGMSMVKEYGKDFGYQSVANPVPWLAGEESLGHAEPRWEKRRD
ncbi:uncharacterized protein BXZ73DRAFT_88711 [Epithele typhae]|uniref:uncharacterized protein n=1 Tax=Epithele typhae TaxID=378194 RepID=UPI002007AB61|nr:uncharacterized protein BXZ73DRAFT_88711 [Epithele typhae]KAH9940480.1 hypothetical protein BXZ73DRAFT_88711 [Epithele typhae]